MILNSVIRTANRQLRETDQVQVLADYMAVVESLHLYIEVAVVHTAVDTDRRYNKVMAVA